MPPWLLRGADPEAVPLDVTRALPLDRWRRARRDLQSSSDACDYVSVSGSTGWSSYHGLYQATGTCDSKPSYECLDCSGSGRSFGITLMATGTWAQTAATRPCRHKHHLKRRPRGRVRRLEEWDGYSVVGQLRHHGHVLLVLSGDSRLDGQV